MSEAVTGTPQTATPTSEQQTQTNTHANESQGSGATPKAQGSTSEMVAEAAKEAVRKHKLKVDGQEIEVDEDELKRGYSHQKAANKILQEGKQAKKQAEQFLNMLKDKGQVLTALKKLGYDDKALRELSEEYLTETLKYEMLDERERKLIETEKKLRAYEEMEARQKKEAEETRLNEMKKKFSEEYSQKFVEALKESRLPANKTMVSEMAKYIHRASKIGFEMTPQEAAKLVREDVENAHRNLYGDVDAETLAKLLGEQGLQKLRSYDVSRLKDPNAQLKTPQEQAEPQVRKRDHSKRMTPQEWRMFNRGK